MRYVNKGHGTIRILPSEEVLKEIRKGITFAVTQLHQMLHTRPGSSLSSPK